MNWQLLLGGMFSLLGIWLIALGGQALARKDNAPLETKVEQALSRLEEIKEQGSPQQKREAEAVEAELGKWAADFDQNRITRQLALQRAKADAQSRGIEDTKEIRKLYEAGIDVVRDRLNAYVRYSKADIKVDLPSIPVDVLAVGGKEWKGTVQFADKVAWALRISAASTDTAVLKVGTTKKIEPLVTFIDEFWVIVAGKNMQGQSVWNTSVSGPNFQTAPGLVVSDAPLSSTDQIKEVMTNLVETQLVLAFPP